MSMKNSEINQWTEVIGPKRSAFFLNLAELIQYRDLIFLFVKRDFVTLYKQTILGPIWYLIQPILTTITFTVIFGKMAKISTDGIPPILFYLAGVTCWGYFAECFNKTSSTFKTNQGLFGKVYFPRIVMPISVVMSCMVKFFIQFLLFLCFVLYYSFETSINVNIYVLALPLLLILMAGISLGFGIIFSSLTTKYRDLTFLLAFGVQLLMYLSPVIYPVSAISGVYQKIMFFNPISHIIETFRYAFLGVGQVSYMGIGYSTCFMFLILFIGIVIFNKIEKNFMDTI